MDRSHSPLSFAPRAARRALIASLLISRSLCAQPSPQEKAAAEALFQSGAELIEQARFAEACEKFEASYALDPAIGTRLRMADCYDRVGRTASAWALFVELVAMARAQGQTDRETIASVRVKDLETRLSRLTIRIQPERRVPGLELKLNGTSIPAASWQMPIPVDPGPQSIEARAPGYAPWSTRIDVAHGPTEQSVDVPALEPVRSGSQGPAFSNGSASRSGDAQAASAPGSARPMIWAGAITGGLGLVGLGVAGVFGYRAYDRNRESLDSCSREDANACTPEGKRLRDDAQQLARNSTIAAVAGGVLVATGVTLLVLAPPAQPATSSRPLRVQAFGAPGAARVQLEGAF